MMNLAPVCNLRHSHGINSLVYVEDVNFLEVNMNT
jgi:hypothetical protein